MKTSKNVREFKRWVEILTNKAAKGFTDEQSSNALVAMTKSFINASDKEKLALTLVYPGIVKEIISRCYTFKIEGAAS